MKRRLEETLEECLAALANGQTTVEDCLALHPGLAAQLEPLLRTARRLQDNYSVDPSPLYAQAARERFLAEMAHRRQRRLAARPVRRPFWRWAPAALGTAAVIALAAWAGVLALGGGGGSEEPAIGVSRITPVSTPVPMASIQEQVAAVQNRLEEIRAGAESGPNGLEATTIEQLKVDTEALVASLDQPEALQPEDVSQIGELLADQEEFLTEVKERVPAQAAQDVDEIIRIAGAGREKAEKMLSPTATATPSATPEASPTATPATTATPEATATETPEVTQEPTAESGEEGSLTEAAAP